MKKQYNSCGCESNVCCPHQDSTEGLCNGCRKIPEKCICKINKKWKWICICCEKEIPIYTDGYAGNDEEGVLPNLEGGTIEIHFGFGSKFDQLEDMLSRQDYRIQGSICDSCFQEKQNLTRKVEVRKIIKYVTKSK
jgi:hypothetical protein